MRDYSLAALASRVADQPGFDELTRAVRRADPGRPVGPLGLPAAARPAVVAALAGALNAPLLWAAEQPDEARALVDALRAYLPRSERVFLLPAPDALPFEHLPWDPATRELRMTALAALHRWGSEDEGGHAPIVVTTARALMTCTLPHAAFADGARVLHLGDRVAMTPFAEALYRLGYENVSNVTKTGQFARRGGIIDLFPPSEPDPVRVEWFGDEIDSLRRFDPASQRSSEALDEVMVVPAAEALPARGPEVARRLASVGIDRLHPLAESEYRRHIGHLERGERFAAIDFYAPLLHPERVTPLDYLPAGGVVVLDDRDGLSAAAENFEGQAETVRAEQIEAGELPPDWPADPLAGWGRLARALDGFRQLVLGTLGAAANGGPPAAAALAEAFGRPPRYGGRIEEAVLEAARIAERGRAVVVVSRQAPRFSELLADVGVHAAPVSVLVEPPAPGGMAVVHGALGAGWTLEHNGAGTTLLTDGELFGWRMPHRRRRARERDGLRPAEYFSELTPGDYVVHIEHGIGLFRGLKRMEISDTERDYLHLEYANSDTLYVPTHQADRVARYVGTGDIVPTVSRLGTADWERAKERAKREVEDIARELLELYAQREVAQRSPFTSDGAWQAEMEAAFPYVETEDQLQAIDDVKRDMESKRPMDRLVVGDVGFGKTEVALRAAFKAATDGRQVAVLAPTTVLAQQHYETFTERMSAFPVEIALLSRFRTRKQQQTTIARLATGEVDIVIGTHRLLSDDIRFRDLGLLIVDEEHRFGVKHKERLRGIREDVDTLTLTATPIPRTMHMALSGLRDLTTISTPPEERRPVVTHVGPFDRNLIRQAVRRELGRGGQVFYVFNRVQGIELIAQRIERLVPDARVDIAHGQMRESGLARAMLDFVARETDVLVCTSIIESGLDIPNANTLIVEHAERFGLAQLHQLRGRVGRSAQRAYAYFLYPRGHELPPDARERLEALAESTELGEGFRLAMRDLEIRGAGDILGARQHGQVAAIGLDLYTRLLAEAIKRLRADQPGPTDKVTRELAEIDAGTLPTVDLPFDAYLPERYIAETAERTRVYRRMAQAESLSTVDEIEHELIDRFGPPPEPVEHLITVLRLRVQAHLADASSVGREGQSTVIRWSKAHDLDRNALKARLPRTTRIGRHQVSLPAEGEPSSWLPKLRRALEIAAEVEGARKRQPSRAL